VTKDQVMRSPVINQPSPHLYSPFWTLPTNHHPSAVASGGLKFTEKNNSNLRYKNIDPSLLLVVSPPEVFWGGKMSLKIVLHLSTTILWSDLIYLHQRKHILFLFRNSISWPSRLNDWSKSTFDGENGSQVTITFIHLGP